MTVTKTTTGTAAGLHCPACRAVMPDLWYISPPETHLCDHCDAPLTITGNVNGVLNAVWVSDEEPQVQDDWRPACYGYPDADINGRACPDCPYEQDCR